jgi:hypothetical protein
VAGIVFRSIVDFLSGRKERKRMRYVILALAAVALAAPAFGDTTFYSGNLRTNGNITTCGAGCALSPSDSDAAWAQWAGYSVSFDLTAAADVTAITYGYGGGTIATGPTVSAGGFEPYLSLFDSSGNFLDSTYDGTTCPAGAASVNGNCYDVELDAGTLNAGTYTLVITAFENMSFAENLGTGTLADGFTGLGNLNGTENLNYAFDLNVAGSAPPPPPPTVPEPASIILLLTGTAFTSLAARRKT